MLESSRHTFMFLNAGMLLLFMRINPIKIIYCMFIYICHRIFLTHTSPSSLLTGSLSSPKYSPNCFRRLCLPMNYSFHLTKFSRCMSVVMLIEVLCLLESLCSFQRSTLIDKQTDFPFRRKRGTVQLKY